MDNEAIGKALEHVLKKVTGGVWFSHTEREKYLIGAVEALSVALLSEPKTVSITSHLHTSTCGPL